MLKKYLIMLVLSVAGMGHGRSQTIVQLTEQLALDIQKLSELKTVLQDLYTDYEVVNKGYSEIKAIAEGNFNLHKLFLDGLLVVSPAVRNYPRVLDIINTEYKIVAEYKAATLRVATDGHFTPEEMNYLGSTYSLLFQRSQQCLANLGLVLADNSLRMSDDGRLREIDRIYEEITGQFRFLCRFDNAAALQAAQRQKAANDLGTLKKLYGLGN